MKQLEDPTEMLRRAARRVGYEISKFKKSLDFIKLKKVLIELGISMILQLGRDDFFQHTIGIVPNCRVALFDTNISCSAFSIVDGSHPDLGLIPFNEKNLTWCSGGMKFNLYVPKK